ncbi:MAG: alpha/beta fold hydrolase [Rhodothermales bacterium]
MKPKLLLLHGALGSKKQLVPIKNLLKEQFDVYTLDFEGHGEYLSNNEFSMALFSQNVIDFLDTEGIDSIHIFGYSMGGYVALQTALEASHRIDKIVTLGTKFDWSVASAEKEVRMLNPDKIEAKVPHFAQQLKDQHHPQDWKTVMHKTADMMLGLAHGNALDEQALKQINHHVSIGLGSLDNMVSLEESTLAAQTLPQASLVQLPDVKHPIGQIAPTVLAKYIRESLG